MAAFAFYQDAVEGGPVGLWWLWILIAVLFLVAIAYVVSRMGGPGGPWASR